MNDVISWHNVWTNIKRKMYAARVYAFSVDDAHHRTFGQFILSVN